MIVSHIVAVSENNAIGLKNALPWNISEDLKFFKEKTLHSIIIMGRKTYESIGRPLPKRVTIVISKTGSQVSYPEGVIIVTSIEDAIKKAKSMATEKNQKEIFVVGGGEIYKQSFAMIDKVYLTRVHLKVDGDAYYPEITEKDFEILQETPSRDDKYLYTFYEYIRRR